MKRRPKDEETGGGNLALFSFGCNRRDPLEATFHTALISPRSLDARSLDIVVGALQTHGSDDGVSLRTVRVRMVPTLCRRAAACGMSQRRVQVAVLEPVAPAAAEAGG